MKIKMTQLVSIGGVIDLLDACRHLPFNKVNNIDFDRLTELNQQSPNSYVPESTIISLWQLLDRYHTDKHIGITLGQQINPNSRGLLTSWMSQAASIGEALEIFTTNISLINASEVWEMHIEGQTCTLICNIDQNKGYPAMAIERSMSAVLSSLRALSNHTFSLHGAYFSYKKPTHCSHYTHVFGRNIKFSSENHCLVFPTKYLKLPIPTSSRLLKEIIAHQAMLTLNSLACSDIYQLVRKTILNGIESGEVPSVDEVSSKLFMSRQTLARRLQLENTSFKSILNDVRQQRALEEIQAGRNSLIEISYLLGFKDSSSFYKAFKRWYGVSPRKYSLNSNLALSLDLR
ncbi:AraC family transcriptional regulator [Vibrio sp. VB16]|uniref:AraC family transcriptional regulator n=1 Tax=Vibrio sp. VB16 TaxID=2785746 RepID=UPI00189E8C3B|nr:AraC family transcriptional regulator [Vibrio sp. VB16]UGA57504.1 AraC family transcriptional regulator [Vibrio sp. VB16]